MSFLCFRYRIYRKLTLLIIRVLSAMLWELTHKWFYWVSEVFISGFKQILTKFVWLCLTVPPTWIKEPEDVRVRAGEDIKVECIADGLPKPVTKWISSKGLCVVCWITLVIHHLHHQLQELLSKERSWMWPNIRQEAVKPMNVWPITALETLCAKLLAYSLVVSLKSLIHLSKICARLLGSHLFLM